MKKHLLILLAVLLIPASVLGTSKAGTRSGLIYVPVSDGVEIALQLFYPDGYDASKAYPALMEIEGYAGAASPNDTTYITDANNGGKYVVIGMSLRGTGCSGGELDLFSDRSSLDGKEIIDDWLPTQTVFNWNGTVGIYGHSYSGLTGFLVAAQNPQNLTAVAVSGLIDDFYRGILYPGGISNPGFPVLWGAGLRPATEHQGNATYYQNDPHCQKNFASHNATDVFTLSALLNTYPNRQATPDSWAIKQGLMNKIANISAPIQLGQQYQDEQTGPRGGHVLWENIPADVPKRIAISTGRHNPNDPLLTKRDWLDCWILQGGNTTKSAQSGASCADVLDPQKRVLLFFEQSTTLTPVRLAPYTAADWPLPESDWRRLNLCASGTLSEAAGGTCDGTVTYASTGPGRHLTLDVGNAVATGAPLAPYGSTTGLPDTARYTMKVTSDTVVAGPLELTLWATSTSPDVDFWVEVLDKGPDGATTFVQRGLLRASMRETDPAKGAAIASGPHAGEIYRPWHPFIDPQPIIPAQAYRYDIEVFPLGHVFRANHEMVVQLHAPPANDPISTYSYEPNLASVVQILQDADHRTNLLVPFLSLPSQFYRATAPACGQVNGEICITPALG